MADYEHMKRAKNSLGLKEVKGSKHSPIILGWLKAIGQGWVKDDETAWCGTFVAANVLGYGDPLPKNPLSARAWLTYGVSTVPQYGAVLVFWRGKVNGSLGHVGFYVGEDATYFYVLGGNQSDSVSITRMPKTRLLGARRPLNAPFPFTPWIVKGDPRTAAVTNGNEA